MSMLFFLTTMYMEYLFIYRYICLVPICIWFMMLLGKKITCALICRHMADYKVVCIYTHIMLPELGCLSIAGFQRLALFEGILVKTPEKQSIQTGPAVAPGYLWLATETWSGQLMVIIHVYLPMHLYVQKFLFLRHGE